MIFLNKRKVILGIADSIYICERNILYAKNIYEINSEDYDKYVSRNRAIKNEMLNLAFNLDIADDVIKKKDKLVEEWKIRNKVK